MPQPTDSSPKAQFNMYKSRSEGGDVAAFLAESDGRVEIIPPDRARALTPQKLKAQLKGKGIAGFFYKGDAGPVFNVVAAKQGGKASQPWVKYILRATLEVSSFDVQTDSGADLDDDRPSTTGTGTTSQGEGLDELDSLPDLVPHEDLDMLDTSSQEDLGLDGLDTLDEQEPPLLIRRGGKPNIQQEWDRIEELAGELPPDMPHPDEDLPPVLRTDQMFAVRDGVSAPLNWEDVSQGGLDEAQERLAFERKATQWMRGNLTRSVNGRSGRAKESLTSNCDMATGLAGILEAHPELLQSGGLLARIVGSVEGQGQHGKKDSAQDVVGRIKAAAGRLKDGGGEGEDANLVLQFIGCFTDGLTEVIEGQQTARQQLDAIWPELCKAFGVEETDQETFKDALLKRVEAYKAIAGGRTDTLSGKGARKKDTREGMNPSDPRLRLTEHEALIKGDVSGSVHSCFLAYELAEVLKDPKNLEIEQDVLLTDRALIDARVLDALAMTAGGKMAPGAIAKEKQTDLVFHTAWEMLNGLRGITGAPAVTQDQATKVLELLWKGKGYTQAMETLFPEERFPWMG